MSRFMTSSPSRELLDTRAAKALSHPVRMRILRVLQEREASPSDIARALDLPIVNVSHHVKVLRELAIIEQIAVRHVRGAVEHRYRLAAHTHLTWTPVQLDEQGWRNVRDRLMETLEAAIAEEAAALARLAEGRTGGPPVRAGLTMLLYETAGPPAGDAGGDGAPDTAS